MTTNITWICRLLTNLANSVHCSVWLTPWVQSVAMQYFAFCTTEAISVFNGTRQERNQFILSLCFPSKIMLGQSTLSVVNNKWKLPLYANARVAVSLEPVLCVCTLRSMPMFMFLHSMYSLAALIRSVAFVVPCHLVKFCRHSSLNLPSLLGA